MHSRIHVGANVHLHMHVRENVGKMHPRIHVGVNVHVHIHVRIDMRIRIDICRIPASMGISAIAPFSPASGQGGMRPFFGKKIF